MNDRSGGGRRRSAGWLPLRAGFHARSHGSHRQIRVQGGERRGRDGGERRPTYGDVFGAAGRTSDAARAEGAPHGLHRRELGPLEAGECRRYARDGATENFARSLTSMPFRRLRASSCRTRRCAMNVRMHWDSRAEALRAARLRDAGRAGQTRWRAASISAYPRRATLCLAALRWHGTSPASCYNVIRFARERSASWPNRRACTAEATRHPQPSRVAEPMLNLGGRAAGCTDHRWRAVAARVIAHRRCRRNVNHRCAPTRPCRARRPDSARASGIALCKSACVNCARAMPRRRSSSQTLPTRIDSWPKPNRLRRWPG